MYTQHRSFDADTGLATGIDEHASAGAIRRPDMARRIDAAHSCHQSARSNDFAHDDSLIQVSAWGGHQYGVAGYDVGLVEPLPEPARSGGAYRAADCQCGPAAG